MEHDLPLRWWDRLHIAIQEHSSQDTTGREVGDGQKWYGRDELPDADVELELGKSLHRPIRSVYERRAPRALDCSAPRVVQYRALQGGWKEKKLSGYDKLSGLGDTRVNNCTVLILIILFYLANLVSINFADTRLDLGSNAGSYCSGSGGAIYTLAL